MSRDGRIDVLFAGDERTFRLAIDQLLALEEKCQCGAAEILWRLQNQRWHVRDVRETIRLGLVGAGVDPKFALRLVDEHAGDGRLLDCVLTASYILMAALMGDPREKVGKEEAAGDASEAMDASPPPRSVEPALSGA